MKTVTREEEKQQTKELVHALMHVKSNRPVCDCCGKRFKPDVDEITVEFPEEDTDIPKASRTSYVEKPDYCSQKCEVADSL